MLLVVRGSLWLIVVACSLFRFFLFLDCCSLLIGYCLLIILDRCLGLWCLVLCIRSLIYVVSCLLFSYVLLVVCCSLFVAWCSSFVVCCSLFVVCCLSLFGVRCALFVVC